MRKSRNKTPHGRRQRRRCDGHGYRRAVIRALTAAGLIINGTAPTVAAAAERCGSNPAYVRAGVAILRSENKSLLVDVINGRLPLVAAAREVQRLSVLVSAYRKASANDRVSFARTIGPTTLFDNDLCPAL